MDRIIRSVEYLQDQTDQAMYLGDSSKQAIEGLLSRMNSFDERIEDLQSTSKSTESVPSRAARLPREVSVCQRFNLNFSQLSCMYI